MKINKYHWRSEDFDSDDRFAKRHKYKSFGSSFEEHANQYREHREHGFTCVQCGFPVTADREESGVNNRNHCPRCLWSRHVDLNKAGDRKAQCRSRMQPIGLTIKHTYKKYGQAAQGELMLIHRCTGCGKFSINRIAADDDAARIYLLYQSHADFSAEFKELFDEQGIHPLGKADLTTVYSQLFGWQAILEEFEVHCSERDDLNSIQIPQSDILDSGTLK